MNQCCTTGIPKCKICDVFMRLTSVGDVYKKYRCPKCQLPNFGSGEEMRGLLGRMVKGAGKLSIVAKPRWSHVSDLLGHGSGYSTAICREFGIDPDEVIGGPGDDGHCPSCRKCLSCGEHDEVEHDPDCGSLEAEYDE